MAVLLDASARSLLAWRRTHDKDTGIHLGLELGSLRAQAPLVLVARWVPRSHPSAAVPVPCSDHGQVWAHPRIARYVESHDLAVSGIRIWRWERLVPADPFILDHVLEWERSCRESNAALPERQRSDVGDERRIEALA